MALITCKECQAEVSNKADACPKCGVKIKKKVALWKKILGGFVLFLIAVAVFSPGGKNGSGTTQSTDSSKGEQAAFNTTAHELAAAYNENTLAADNKFKGKRFVITGVVSDINTDMFNNAVVMLHGGVNQFMEPQARLAESEKPKAAELKKGASISLTCTGRGDVAKTPMMEKCVLM